MSGCQYFVRHIAGRKRWHPVRCGKLPTHVASDEDYDEDQRQLCPAHFATVACTDLREALKDRANTEFDHATVAEARRLIAEWGLS